MNIIVINANPKRQGSLATLVAEVSDAVAQNGAAVEELRLADLKIGYCRFCMNCYKDKDSEIGSCVQDDDMKWILPKLKAADGYVIATQVSSGHANAILKTFIERSIYTAGCSKGQILWLKGIPTSRFTDRQRFAVTLVTAGAIPTWLRKLCDTATAQMKEHAKLAFNAKVVGTLYAGELLFKGLKQTDVLKARALGDKLVAETRRSQSHRLPSKSARQKEA